MKFESISMTVNVVDQVNASQPFDRSKASGITTDAEVSSSTGSLIPVAISFVDESEAPIHTHKVFDKNPQQEFISLVSPSPPQLHPSPDSFDVPLFRRYNNNSHIHLYANQVSRGNEESNKRIRVLKDCGIIGSCTSPPPTYSVANIGRRVSAWNVAVNGGYQLRSLSLRLSVHEPHNHITAQVVFGVREDHNFLFRLDLQAKEDGHHGLQNCRRMMSVRSMSVSFHGYVSNGVACTRCFSQADETAWVQSASVIPPVNDTIFFTHNLDDSKLSCFLPQLLVKIKGRVYQSRGVQRNLKHCGVLKQRLMRFLLHLDNLDLLAKSRICSPLHPGNPVALKPVALVLFQGNFLVDFIEWLQDGDMQGTVYIAQVLPHLSYIDASHIMFFVVLKDHNLQHRVGLISQDRILHLFDFIGQSMFVMFDEIPQQYFSFGVISSKISGMVLEVAKYFKDAILRGIFYWWHNPSLTRHLLSLIVPMACASFNGFLWWCDGYSLEIFGFVSSLVPLGFGILFVTDKFVIWRCSDFIRLQGRVVEPCPEKERSSRITIVFQCGVGRIAVKEVEIAEDVTKLSLWVYLNNGAKGCVECVVAKVEMMEPCSSVKDSTGYNMIYDAEATRLVKPRENVLIEPTSDNDGIGLPFMADAKGDIIIITMPNPMSLERTIIILAFDSELDLTDFAKGMNGVVQKTDEIKVKPPTVYILQLFDSPMYPKLQYETEERASWKGSNGNIATFVSRINTRDCINFYHCSPDRAINSDHFNARVKILLFHALFGHTPPNLSTCWSYGCRGRAYEPRGRGSFDRWRIVMT